MSTYKLTYLNAKGKAEVTRKLFALGEQKYEDERFEREHWEKIKDKTSMLLLHCLSLFIIIPVYKVAWS